MKIDRLQTSPAHHDTPRSTRYRMYWVSALVSRSRKTVRESISETARPLCSKMASSSRPS